MEYSLENVRQLSKGVKTIFNKAMEGAKHKDYLDVATQVNTQSHTVDYAWLGDLPEMRPWVDERDFSKLKDYKYTIQKQDWEASIYVMRDDFLFDNLAIVKPKVQQLAHAVVRHYNSLVFSLIPANGTCFDGQPFFGAHTLGATQYVNKTEAALSEQALFDAIGFMQTITNSNGMPLDINPSLLLVAPDLYKTALQITQARQIDGSDNVAQGLVSLKVVKQMAPGTWCLMDNTQPLKPLVLQITKEGRVEEDSSQMFAQKRVNYGIDTMDNVGYGFWQMAYLGGVKAKAAKRAE